jgi:hypothetical protein
MFPHSMPLLKFVFPSSFADTGDVLYMHSLLASIYVYELYLSLGSSMVLHDANIRLGRLQEVTV